MANNVPVTHTEEAQKLSPDAEVSLWVIQPTTGGAIYFKENDSVVWQGNTYEGLPIQFSGESLSSDDTKSRPSLTIGQPDNLFKPFLFDQHLDGSIVTKHTLLNEDLLLDANIKRTQIWLCTHVAGYTRNSIQLVLRKFTDGPNFKFPARAYLPPDFPNVSI